MPTQVKAKAKGRKIGMSFTNWVLGGSLVSLTAPESSGKKSSEHRIIVTETDSDGDRIITIDPSTGTATKSKGKNYKKHSKSSDDDDDKKKSDGKEKKDEGKKKDGKKHGDDEGKKKDDDDDDDDDDDEGWTEKQDKIIKSMKDADTTWSQIANVVGKSKDEVRERYKELTSELKVGGDGNKKDKEKKDDREKDGGGDKGIKVWKTEQDKKIKSMKAENKSWKDIAMEVGASKKEVQTRFKELEKDSQANDSGSGVGDGGSGKNGGSMRESFDDGGGLDFTELFTDDNWGTSAQKEKKKDKSKQQNNSPNNSSGMQQQQADSTQGRLQADELWTKEDVEILELLEGRYTEHKWLHIQAAFFNWTGRMLIAEMIEEKFKNDGVI